MPSLDDAAQQAPVIDLDYGEPSSSSMTLPYPHTSITASSQPLYGSAAPSTGAPWTTQDWNEACKLVEELHSYGMSPSVLVERGVNAQVVDSCCRALGIPFSSQPSLGNRETPDDSSVKRKKKKKSKRARQIEEQQAARPAAQSSSNDVERDTSGDLEVAELARKARATMKAARESAGSSGNPIGLLENDASAPNSAPIHVPQTSSTDDLDVKAMRAKALASMKRSKPANTSSKTSSHLSATAVTAQPPPAQASAVTRTVADNGQAVDNGQNYEGYQQEGNRAPLEPEGAPKRPRPIYHDVDAPEPGDHYDVIVLDDDDLAAAAHEAASTSRNGHRSGGSSSDVANERLRVSYADDDWAPSGDVDYSAPLPSLQTPRSATFPSTAPSLPGPSSSYRNRRPVAADLIDKASRSHAARQPPPAPPAPFLSSHNYVKFDWSDDEDKDADAGPETERQLHARQMQSKTDSEFLELFRTDKERDRPAKAPQQQQQSQHDDTRLTEAVTELAEKERAIQELMQRIRQAEARGSKVPAKASTVASMARKAVEEQARNDDHKKRKASDQPLQENDMEEDGVSGSFGFSPQARCN
ncbi:hypothetical protein FA10DRAFT_122804 [Acaromyces ingoldii]|uniref:Uncharacterized protein n=1 Tax=Acaromyces ingoldii TaxID=215250 RepID=A0A316YSQ4_9BASI|nr:hypothetical protein FA10DRAFT_122804 [Acaromyces ingoldii]PWN90755.1 hypothetical protein FA10DRAFT_122804 [Acaromyces ingoldii]